MRIFRFAVVLFLAGFLATPLPSRAAVNVTITATLAPPPLPVYVQPAIPAPGYLWIPGYWAWGPYGYYWVPGTWVLPPAIGLLWTPGYWGWRDGYYVWHAGYWGPHVGFYGGVVYGFGYFGTGYAGGFWDHDRFHYNSAVNNFGHVHVTNVYNQTVVNNVNITQRNVSRVSFNGGVGGIAARPDAAQESAAHERHQGPTNLQTHHAQLAAGNRSFAASVNHGNPAIAATPRAAAFTPRGTGPSHNGAPHRDDRNGAHQVSQHGPQAAPQQQAAPQFNGGPQGGESHGGGPHGGGPQGEGPHGGEGHGGGRPEGRGPDRH